MLTLTQLTEVTFSESHTVDRDAGVIRGVKVLGRESRNGREYSDRPLTKQPGSTRGSASTSTTRSSRDECRAFCRGGFGWLAGVAVKTDGVYADLHYLRSHPQAAVIVEAASATRSGSTCPQCVGRVARPATRLWNQVEPLRVALGGFDDDGRLRMRAQIMEIGVHAVSFHRDPASQPKPASTERSTFVSRRSGWLRLTPIPRRAGCFVKGPVAVLAAVARFATEHLDAADHPRVAIDRV